MYNLSSSKHVTKAAGLKSLDGKKAKAFIKCYSASTIQRSISTYRNVYSSYVHRAKGANIISFCLRFVKKNQSQFMFLLFDRFTITYITLKYEMKVMLHG